MFTDIDRGKLLEIVRMLSGVLAVRKGSAASPFISSFTVRAIPPEINISGL